MMARQETTNPRTALAGASGVHSKNEAAKLPFCNTSETSPKAIADFFWCDRSNSVQRFCELAGEAST